MNISLIPTEVKPRTILKHKIKSEMRQRCSSDSSFKKVNRSVYRLIVWGPAVSWWMYDGRFQSHLLSECRRATKLVKHIRRVGEHMRWMLVWGERYHVRGSRGKWVKHVGGLYIFTKLTIWRLNFSLESINTPRSLIGVDDWRVWFEME